MKTNRTYINGYEVLYDSPSLTWQVYKCDTPVFNHNSINVIINYCKKNDSVVFNLIAEKDE